MAEGEINVVKAHAAAVIEGAIRGSSCGGCRQGEAMSETEDQLAKLCERQSLELKSLRSSLAKCREAVRLAWPLVREDENSNDRFERIATWFYKETGMLRPGKDCRCDLPDCEEARRKRWDGWISEKWKRVSDGVEAALAGGTK